MRFTKKRVVAFSNLLYQECLSLELALQEIPFQEQVELHLNYKDCPLAQTYIPDFICFDKIILEIKAVTTLNDKL